MPLISGLIGNQVVQILLRSRKKFYSIVDFTRDCTKEEEKWNSRPRLILKNESGTTLEQSSITCFARSAVSFFLLSNCQSLIRCSFFVYRYQTVETSESGVFKGVSDRFNGITIDSTTEPCDDVQFDGILSSTLLSKIYCFEAFNKRLFYSRIAELLDGGKAKGNLV